MDSGLVHFVGPWDFNIMEVLNIVLLQVTNKSNLT
jgi:hypothetical protein